TGRRWLAVNLQTGEEYEIELPLSFLRQVAMRGKAAGWDRGSEGPKVLKRGGRFVESGDAAGPVLGDLPEKPLGWSDGDDTRTRRFDNTVYPYRAMGQIGGGTLSGCSGTLVGRRHVLTAAHCLWNVKTNSWSTATGFRFRPGREGTGNNASCEPYGEYTAIWFFTPVEFRETESFTYDYGIAVTSGFPGNLTGWLGYVGISQALTNDYCDMVPFGPGYLGGSCINRGYPACGFVENASLSGNNCQQGWAYQDVWPCEVGSFSNTGPDGWKSIFKTNCDLGRGHSGSAVFINNYNGNGKVVIGVTSFQNCATCPDGNDFPNGIRRVTPDILDWISYFKTVKFP
ncbi:MAG: trypsin-like serine peptidase, partial [Vicinamibacteria bacterium]